MSTTDKLIITNYPYTLDIPIIQEVFGIFTNVLIDYHTKTVIIQYNTKEDATYYYVKRSHKMKKVEYCTEERLEEFLDKQYELHNKVCRYTKLKPLSAKSITFRPPPLSARRILFSD